MSIDDASVRAPAAFGAANSNASGSNASGSNDTDEALVDRARARDSAAFELLMRRHNQRVYRVVRSVLRDTDDIEDVIQQAYVQAFLHLDQFGGAARWSTWVCRIAINEALARLRQRGRFVSIDAVSEEAMSDFDGFPAAIRSGPRPAASSARWSSRRSTGCPRSIGPS